MMADANIPNRPGGGDARSIAAILANFDAITDQFNGNVDAENLTTAIVEAGGFNGSSARRGKKIIATDESTTSTALTLMTTPDRVSSIVLPTDGLIFLMYQAELKSTVAQNARASIYLGNNPVAIARQSAAAASAYVMDNLNSPSAINVFRALTLSGTGFYCGGSLAYTGDQLSTGQILGHDGAGGFAHPAIIEVNAGTYDVSVRFANQAAGTINVRNRKLWVWTMGF